MKLIHRHSLLFFLREQSWISGTGRFLFPWSDLCSSRLGFLGFRSRFIGTSRKSIFASTFGGKRMMAGDAVLFSSKKSFRERPSQSLPGKSTTNPILLFRWHIELKMHPVHFQFDMPSKEQY